MSTVVFMRLAPEGNRPQVVHFSSLLHLRTATFGMVLAPRGPWAEGDSIVSSVVLHVASAGGGRSLQPRKPIPPQP